MVNIMAHDKQGKSFSEQPERVSETGKKSGGLVKGNLKRDPGRAVESGHRSNQGRQDGNQ